MSLEKIWSDYCENSSIHGLRHVIQDKKPLEKIIWVLLMVVASATILVLLSLSWEKYSYSSMEIVVDDPRYSLSKIDFPAVTICPINKIMYSRAVDLISNKYINNSELEVKWLNALQAFGMFRYPHYTDLHYFLETKTMARVPLDDISDIMLKLAPTIEDIFHKCYWRGLRYNCSDILRLQRTEEGFCYSFNSKTAKRSINDSELNPPLAGPHGTLIPLRNNAAGKGTGFKVILHNLSDEYFPTDDRRRGFNVMVHTPEDFPDVTTAYKVHTAIDRTSRISVSVSQVLADDSLYRLNEQNRKCFMHRPRSIFDKGESASSSSRIKNDEDTCHSKCRIQTIHKKCNCTPYYFDVYKGIGKHCGTEHIKCLIDNDVLQRNDRAPVDEPGFPAWSLPAYMNCSCPLSCSFISYTTEIQHDLRQYINQKPLHIRYMVYLEINYGELFVTNYRRSMKYTTQDLLVSFGGVASLFLGVSLVSVVEILYVVYKTLLVLKCKCKQNEICSSESADTPHYSFTN